jgi:hypothetical protein
MGFTELKTARHVMATFSLKVPEETLGFGFS